MLFVRKYGKWLFWAAIGFIILLGFRTIGADPTRFGDSEQASVIISEFMARQRNAIAEGRNEQGDNADDSEPSVVLTGWIELYNQSSRAVNLESWTLTDDATDPDKWPLPNVDIGPGAYLLLWAKDATLPEATDPENSVIEGDEEPIVSGISLNPQGGFLALYPPTVRRYVDALSIRYPPQLHNTSFGRTGPDPTSAPFGYLATATPGLPNDSDFLWAGMAEPVVFSEDRGFFQEPFTLSLSTETQDAAIWYTTDGSTPTVETGERVSGEIPIERTTLVRAVAIKTGYLPSEVNTHSYIFFDDVLAQPKNPAGVSDVPWPESWGTHRITLFGFNKGDPVQPDYEMDPKVTEDPKYRDLMVDSLVSIPSISLVADSSDLDIYFVDPQMRGPQSERPASVEFIYPDDVSKNFHSNTGLRIQGGAGRWEYMPKHSFRLFFRQEYGVPRLYHKVFDDSRQESFNTLVLRGGVGRSFAGHPNTVDQPFAHNEHHWTTYARDEWARDSQIALSGIGSHGTFYHLYLNGLYWGLYNIVERPDSDFAADYYGGDANEWFTASHGGAGDGLIDRFTVMRQLAAAGGLAEAEKYATMLEFIDPIHFSDYMILNWAMGNRDWPENNWYTNVKYPAGRNLFYVWDAENSWNVGAELRLGGVPKDGAPFPNIAKILFDALMENEEYRLLLADRLSAHLRNGGLLTTEPMQERWRAISEPLELPIIAESARWGDTRYDEPITQADWRIANEAVLQQMEGNAERLLQQVRAAGYYPPIEPPSFSQHGGPFETQLMLEITAQSPTEETTERQIYFTVDERDPREPGALIYSDPIQISAATTVKARQQIDGVWSALTEARFRRLDQQGDIRFTEIMYNPLDGAEYGEKGREADRYEFVELQNVGEDEVDLSYAYFEGITMIFPGYTTLGPGERMVLIRDFRAFRQRYPTADFHGIFTGQLSNGGESLILNDVHGRTLTSVTYDDNNGWPLSADGVGDSLVLLTQRGSADNPQNWGVSANIHGNPGE